MKIIEVIVCFVGLLWGMQDLASASQNDILPEQVIGPPSAGLFLSGSDSKELFASLKLDRRYSWGGYTVDFFQKSGFPEVGAFEVAGQEGILHRMEGGKFFIGSYDPEAEALGIKNYFGRDLTGDGRPNLAIWEYSGGAHCCNALYIFELDPEFRFLTVIYGRDSDVELNDLDGDGVPEISLLDDTFAYWNACYSESPAPKVIFRRDGDEYVLATDLMCSPVPPWEELVGQVNSIWRDYCLSWQIVRPDSWSEVQSGKDMLVEKADVISVLENPPPRLWGVMLDLIYSGNWDAAWEFYDQACPGYLWWKNDFAREFSDQLATSPYWLGICVISK